MIVIVKDGDGYVQVTDDGVTTTLFPNIDDIGGSGGGMTISALPSIIVKNNRSSGTINVNHIHYSATTIFKPVRTTMTTGSTATYTNMASDGSHFWIDCSSCSTVSYDGETCEFVRDGTSFMVTLPDNFDATIPFAFS